MDGNALEICFRGLASESRGNLLLHVAKAAISTQKHKNSSKCCHPKTAILPKIGCHGNNF